MPPTEACISCEEEDMKDNEDEECPVSERDCKHHCNHSWSHDECCWCGEQF